MRSSLVRNFVLILAGTWALSASAEDARSTFEETLDQVLAVLRTEGSSEQVKLSQVETIALNRFDFDLMTRLVLARNYRKLSEQQRADFEVEFRKHMSLTYGRRLLELSEEVIEIGESRTEKNADVTLKTRVVGGAADGVTIDYRHRERDGSWYIIDVIIEGVSLISNFRSQVKEIMTESGADRLIEILHQKNAKDSATG
ncbi:MAG: ABC transporter substrate-binding protein [Myxococcota bacterium]